MVYYDIQFILIFLNFILLAFLFFYSIYLFALEKRVKNKYKELTTKTTEIIEEANRKAIEILKKSEFISDDLKGEIDTNFESILSQIKDQNMSFYADLKTHYEKNSTEIMDRLEKETSQEIEKISRKSEQTQQAIQNKLEEEAKEVEIELENEKKVKLEAFELQIRELVKKNLKDVVKTNIPEEIHEKIAKDSVAKALAEIKKNG